MLKVNVGLSRKVRRDFNSTGFSLNLEGELCGTVDDPETLIERIKEYYDLADEALRQQVERYESDAAIASRDEQPANPPKRESRAEPEPATPSKAERETPKIGNGNGNGPTNVEAATNKQIQFLLNLGKRNGLTQPQLEKRFEQQFGRRVGLYELSKREAGDAISALNVQAAPASNGNGRAKAAH